jgi:hypothetical protein
MICKKTVGRVVMISGAILTCLVVNIAYATNNFTDNKFENKEKKSSQQWDLNDLPDLHDESITDWLNDEKAYKPFNTAFSPNQLNSSYGFIPTLDLSQDQIDFNVIREKGEITAKPDGNLSLMIKGYNTHLGYEFNVLKMLTAENLKLIDELQQQMNLFIQRNNNPHTKKSALKARRTDLLLNLSKVMLKENAPELPHDLYANIATTINAYNTTQIDPYTTVLCTWFFNHSQNNVKYPMITADSPILKCLNVDLEMLMKDLHAFAQHELRITFQLRLQQQQAPQTVSQPIQPHQKLPCQSHSKQQKPKQATQPQADDDKPRVLLVQGPNDFHRPTQEEVRSYHQRCSLLLQQQYFQQLQQVQREKQTQQEQPRVLYVQGPNDYFGLTQQQLQVPQQLNPQIQNMNQPIQGMDQLPPSMQYLNNSISNF